MFSIPLNLLASHRQPASSPALILSLDRTNVMNLDRDVGWIVNCRSPSSRVDGSADFFKPKDDIAPDPLRGLR